MFGSFLLNKGLCVSSVCFTGLRKESLPSKWIKLCLWAVGRNRGDRESEMKKEGCGGGECVRGCCGIKWMSDNICDKATISLWQIKMSRGSFMSDQKRNMYCKLSQQESWNVFYCELNAMKRESPPCCVSFGSGDYPEIKGLIWLLIDRLLVTVESWWCLISSFFLNTHAPHLSLHDYCVSAELWRALSEMYW